jgi:hypothetical protein
VLAPDCLRRVGGVAVTERRFSDGDVFDIPPMQFRIVQGNKRPVAGETDLRIEWRHVAPWQPVTLDHVALVLDAVAENEDIALFPPRLGFKGNAYVVEFCNRAIRYGHGPARCWLQETRARRHNPKDYR